MTLSPAAIAELVRRHRAKEEADLALGSYILALCHQLEIDPARWLGFDDASGAIMLAPDEVKVEENGQEVAIEGNGQN